MSFVQFLPDILRAPDKKEDVIVFLTALNIRWHIKKYTLLEWGKEQGVKITRDDVVALGGMF